VYIEYLFDYNLVYHIDIQMVKSYFKKY